MLDSLFANVKINITPKGAPWEAGLSVVRIADHEGRPFWRIFKRGVEVYANLDLATALDAAARMLKEEGLS